MPISSTSPASSGLSLLGVHDRPRPRLTRRIVAAVAAVTIVAAVAGGVAVAASGDEADHYRTATAGLQSVAQTLAEVAVIEPASQAAISFPVSGTVASVDVAVGDTVDVSTPLASLDAGSLQAAVHTAQAELDQAELTLERALNGEDVGIASGPLGSFNGASLTDDDTTIMLISTQQATDDAVRDAQVAVLEAQRQVDDDLRAAGDALASAQQICAALGEDTEVPEGEEPTGPSAEDLSACQASLTDVLAAQSAVQESQNELAAASRALDELLTELASQPSDDPTTPTAPAPDQDQTPSPSNNGAAPNTSAGDVTSSSPSSADLIAYQQAVDAAEVQVAVAEQAVKQATIRSPIAGTVMAVNLAAGDSVSAGSSTANITIVGQGGYEVTATVSVDDLPDLEIGQPATITPDGTTQAIAGEIVNIGVTATSSDGAVTYPVTIGITGDSTSLRNGSIASVAIVTDDATEALAVPTSAVHADNGQHSVTVLDGTTTREVDVEIGAIGATWTEVTRGLDGGEVVVLADLDEPLPGTATDSSGTTQGNFPGGGQLPGGGRFPAVG
jgi:multidrug efflux pump subunit AcrA (membrane-fusion protein)